MTTVYTPGDWTALTRAEGWALVRIPITDPRVQQMWAALDVSAEATIDVLLAGRLADLPPFVLVRREDDRLHAMIRGAATLTLDTSSESVTYDGAQPWRDLELPVPDRMVLAADVGAPAFELPMAGGVVPAARVTITLSGVAPAAAPAAAEPVRDHTVERRTVETEPEPEPEPEPEIEPGIEPGIEPATDHASTYFQLLTSNTSERDALLVRLRSEDEPDDRPDDGPEAAPAAGVPADAGATGIWSEESSQWLGSDAAPEPPPEPARPSAPSGVIDGLPWATTPPPPPGPPRAPDTLPATPAFAAPSPPAPPAPPAPSTPPAPVAAVTEVPDGPAVTTSRAELLRQLEAEREVGPSVLAVSCQQGHLSPPTAAACRVCGAPVPEQQPVRVARPSLGTLRLSTGGTLTLDRGVVFGRAPGSDVTDAADRPHLVRLAESDEISRMHACITLDGWQVLLRDLGSQNGTFLTLPGGTPEQIRTGEDYTLEPGSVVSLAEIVDISFEVGP